MDTAREAAEDDSSSLSVASASADLRSFLAELDLTVVSLRSGVSSSLLSVAVADLDARLLRGDFGFDFDFDFDSDFGSDFGFDFDLGDFFGFEFDASPPLSVAVSSPLPAPLPLSPPPLPAPDFDFDFDFGDLDFVLSRDLRFEFFLVAVALFLRFSGRLPKVFEQFAAPHKHACSSPSAQNASKL